MAGGNAKSLTDKLCVSCALCCDGTIFRDVKLRKGDDPSLARRLGVTLGKGAKLPQPCAALKGCLCNVYSERPGYCRQFECALFKNVSRGDISAGSASRLIRATKRKAGEMRALLKRVGCNEEHLSLTVRFQKLNARLCGAPLDKETAVIFADLTLAAHELRVLVGENFYPGPRVHGEE